MSEGSVTAPDAAVPEGTAATEPVQAPAAPGDFDARLRQGGDFAVEQVKNAQRELSRMKTKFKELDQVVDALGGSEVLLGHLRRLNTLVSNPAMRHNIEEFERTGQVSSRSNSRADTMPDDEIEEPWTSDLQRNQQEVASLRAELNSLRGERGVEKVQGFFKTFYDEFPLADDARQQLSEGLQEQAKKWAVDPNGLNVLKSMDYQTFRALALGKLTKEQLWTARAREEEIRRGARSAAATDSPSGVRTQANEEPARLSPKDAFIQACREFGHNPYRPLI